MRNYTEITDPDDPGEDAPDLAEGVYKVATSWGTQGLAPYLLHFHLIFGQEAQVFMLGRNARSCVFNLTFGKNVV